MYFDDEEEKTLLDKIDTASKQSHMSRSAWMKQAAEAKLTNEEKPQPIFGANPQLDVDGFLSNF